MVKIKLSKKKKTGENLKSDFDNILSLDNLSKDIPEPEPAKEAPKQQAQSSNINLQGFGDATSMDQQLTSEDIENLRTAIADNLTKIEAAAFKAFTGVPLEKEEESSLQTSWKMVCIAYIKTLEHEQLIALFMIMVSHGAIITAHKDDIAAALETRKQKRRDKQLESEAPKKPPAIKEAPAMPDRDTLKSNLDKRSDEPALKKPPIAP